MNDLLHHCPPIWEREGLPSAEAWLARFVPDGAAPAAPVVPPAPRAAMPAPAPKGNPFDSEPGLVPLVHSWAASRCPWRFRPADYCGCSGRFGCGLHRLDRLVTISDCQECPVGMASLMLNANRMLPPPRVDPDQ